MGRVPGAEDTNSDMHRSDVVGEVDIRKDTDSRSPMTFSKLNLKLSKLSLSRTNKRESFKYKRLPKDSIRLLTVLLRDDASPEIQLETYSRDRAPDFDALSYTWGEDTSTSVILCNKLQLTIRTNLFEAIPLISSSRPPPHRPLWIDAICLNQRDHQEKADHVPLMGSTYEGAARTLIWLGHTADGSDRVMESLPALTIHLQSQSVDEAERLSTSDSRAVLKHYGLPWSGSRNWAAIQSLFKRPWFYRLWTLQEIVLAQNPIVICGNRCLVWEELPSFVKAVHALDLGWLCFGRSGVESQGPYYHDPGDPKYHGDYLISQVHEMRARLLPERNAMLPTLLNMSEDRGYTVPVDRIWAIMGLLSPTARRIIQEADLVKYTSSAYDQTFLAVMRIHDEFGPLVFMLLLEQGITHAKNPQLPSWCPDWHAKKVCAPVVSKPGMAAGRPNGKSIMQSQSLHGRFKLHEPVMSLDHCCLTVLGLSLDTVTATSENTGVFWSTYLVNDVPDWLRVRSSCVWATESLSAVAGQLREEPPAEVGNAALIGLYATLEECVRVLNLLLFPDELPDVFANLVLWANGRKFFRTDRGKYGLGHPDMKVGDVVSVLYGGESLVLLRPVEEMPLRDFKIDTLEGYLLRIVGDAYMPGLMHGECFRDRGYEHLEQFVLI
jgi:hypothetical protein